MIHSALSFCLDTCPVWVTLNDARSLGELMSWWEIITLEMHKFYSQFHHLSKIKTTRPKDYHQPATTLTIMVKYSILKTLLYQTNNFFFHLKAQWDKILVCFTSNIPEVGKEERREYKRSKSCIISLRRITYSKIKITSANQEYWPSYSIASLHASVSKDHMIHKNKRWRNIQKEKQK